MGQEGAEADNQMNWAREMEGNLLAAHFFLEHLGSTHSFPSPSYPQTPLAKGRHMLCISGPTMGGFAVKQGGLCMFCNVSIGDT